MRADKNLDSQGLEYWQQLEVRAKKLGKSPNLNVMRDLVAAKFKTQFRTWAKAREWASNLIFANFSLSGE